MALNNGCSDSYSSFYNFPGGQPAPASLPPDTPATAIAYSFPTDSCFGDVSVDSIGAAIDAIVAVSCDGQNVTGLAQRIAVLESEVDALAGTAAGGGSTNLTSILVRLSAVENALCDCTSIEARLTALEGGTAADTTPPTVNLDSP